MLLDWTGSFELSCFESFDFLLNKSSVNRTGKCTKENLNKVRDVFAFGFSLNFHAR